jgi:hypothetical protein
MLAVLLLVESDEEKRLKGVEKAIRSLDRYMEDYPADGCCDEGPMYWGAAGGGLNICLELLYFATDKTLDIYDAQIVKDIGGYLYKVFIHDDYFVDFADGDAIVRERGGYTYGKNIGDENLIRLGATGIKTAPFLLSWFDVYANIQNVLLEREKRDANLTAPYVKDAWMPVSQVMAARETGNSPMGLYMAAKAGHNGESHNHNDIGNFIVYADGKPVFIDLGTEEYVAKTFSPQRFELWYLQSQYHNCPTVNGVMQHDGKEYKASDVTYVSGGDLSCMEADISGAYPAEAGIIYWRRSCCLYRGIHPRIEIKDAFSLKSSPKKTAYHFMAAVEPVNYKAGEITLKYGEDKTIKFTYDHTCLRVEIEKIAVTESRLQANWGDTLYRINLTEKEAVREAERRFTISLPGRPVSRALQI